MINSTMTTTQAATDNAGSYFNHGRTNLLTFIFSVFLISYTNLYYLSQAGLILSFYMLMRFIESLGKFFSIRELISVILLLQMIVSPVIIYNVFNNETLYPMDIAEETYITFTLISSCCFICGLFFPISGSKGKFYQIHQNIKEFNHHNEFFGFLLIGVGFAATFLGKFIQGPFQFFITLLEAFRYVGLFYLLFSKNRFSLIWLFLIYGFLALLILAGGVFIDLFAWSLMLLILLALKYKFSFMTKLMIFASGVFLGFLTQSVKSEYRNIIWNNHVEDEEVIFLDLASNKLSKPNELYAQDNFNSFISRLNQGWILAKTMDYMPSKQPFVNGEKLSEEIVGVILPRILAPNKAKVGGEEGRAKFAKFTGRGLVGSTTMNIGYFADGYANFGYYGAFLFMLAFGLLVNYILTKIFILSDKYPTLIFWIPMIFFYTMRAGNDFYVIVNYMVKGSFLVFLVFMVYKNKLIINTWRKPGS